MPLPPVRAIVLGVAVAVSALSLAARAEAPHSAVRLKLDSVTSLDPSRATPENDALSIATADRIEGNPQDEIHLIGNAEIRRGGAVLTADRITYRQETDEVTASGNARVSRQGASFAGPSMSFRLTSRSGTMHDADWEYAPRNLRGCAKNIRFLSGDRTTFEDVTATTCRRDEQAWFISLSELEIDEYDKTATGTGAVLHFQGAPILASPWFSFPVGTERRSGLLTPTFSMSSSRGFDLAVPYYFNIAPNYDYTVTPRVMTKRGVMLGNEARFLEGDFSAQVNFDWLPEDRETKEDRWGTRIQARYRRDRLSASIDYNRVSDDDYVSDFSGSIRNTSETILPQNYTLNWTENYWNAMLRVTKNQKLFVDGISPVIPYEREPQFTFRGLVADWKGLEFETLLDATRFTHATFVGGTRVVASQSASLPLRGAGWFIIPKAEVTGAWYSLTDLDREGGQFRSKDPSRFTHTLSLDAGLEFERDTTFFGRNAYQTFEPRLYYAYTPYRNQDDIPLFDSSVVDLSFPTLFTPNLYSGYDRISEANQLTTALSTRYIDRASGLELFRASIGQRQYFSHQRVTFLPAGTDGEHFRRGYYSSVDENSDSMHSDLLASVGARLTQNLYGSMMGQYSTSADQFNNAKLGLMWHPAKASTLGLYYRYKRSTATNDADRIRQIDLQMQWPITERLYALARYNYSLRSKKPVEMIGGLEYLHDCWTMRVAAQRYTTASNEEESSFFIQLELYGLGSIGVNPIAELRRNIRGYHAEGPMPVSTDPYDYYE